MNQRYHKRFLDCKNLTLEEAEDLGTWFCEIQRDVMFDLGDLARYAEARWPDTWHQAFPEWVSPGLLARAAGVCRAYPNEADRQHECTYSQYLQVSGKPDRQQLLAEMVEKGQTTDESRAAQKADTVRVDAPSSRWLLAVDTNYYVHRFWHSGAGVEAAKGVAEWIERTAKRLQRDKGLTDLACCFDSTENHRKKLTENWDDKYKDRGPKDPELIQQINLTRDVLARAGFATISVDEMEADDVMCSFATQFEGKVTLLTQDKDMRQCLGPTCNILLDVEWSQDETSGDHLPDYKWLYAKTHTKETGIPPERWVELQILMGDNVDGIRGAEGIGEKGAKNLITTFGSAEACIQAAKDNDERLLSMTRGKIMAKSLLEFEPKLETTRKLVTLVDNLNIPNSTRIT